MMKKTQVAPKVEVTILRTELEAAHNERLAQKVRESLKMSIRRVRYFTVLGMLRMGSDRFNEFKGTRFSKIKLKTDIQKRIIQAAFLGTRQQKH
jgi:hypothetical protein